uniref:Uncharacterized protein n=1 Tax=Pyxicephalus adspersus TaxID=30357 RepID=A0AAV3B779_PYXAD|nr:TPA: hypothetical protein GDO54_001812 [Pyxicephalus adspersus]
MPASLKNDMLQFESVVNLLLHIPDYIKCRDHHLNSLYKYSTKRTHTENITEHTESLHKLRPGNHTKFYDSGLYGFTNYGSKLG